MFGISNFTAIINPPESSIFAIGMIEEYPFFIDGNWEMIPVMNITASFDHRFIDGVYGAKILNSVKDLLESPEIMLV